MIEEEYKIVHDAIQGMAPVIREKLNAAVVPIGAVKGQINWPGSSRETLGRRCDRVNHYEVTKTSYHSPGQPAFTIAARVTFDDESREFILTAKAVRTDTEQELGRQLLVHRLPLQGFDARSAANWYSQPAPEHLAPLRECVDRCEQSLGAS